MPKHPNRRRLLLAAPALLVLPGLTRVPEGPTPAQMEGPFYPRTMPTESDADLTRYGDRTVAGEVVEMAGQVRDLKGMPIQGAIVEIWHCDGQGIYPHVGRNNGGLADPDFQGFGAVKTATDGAYLFRTIRPGLYPGRVRHIHVKVRHSKGVLTTQMYFPEEDNSGDFLFLRGGDALVASRVDGPPPRYVFDVFVA